MKRTNLGIFISKEELDSIKLIQNKLTTSAQMLNMIPSDVSDDEMDQYVRSVIKIRGETTWLEQDWWNEILKKYNQAGEIHIDFETRGLFKISEER